MPPGFSSTTSAVGLSSSVISGCSLWKAVSRGISQATAKAGDMETWTGRWASASVSASTPRRMLAKPSARSRASAAPSGVSLTPRPSRTARLTPSRSSSARTCWITAPCVTFSACPARE